MVAIHVNNYLWGVLAFEDFRIRDWLYEEEEVLNIAVAIIGSALIKRITEAKLEDNLNAIESTLKTINGYTWRKDGDLRYVYCDQK
jgi:GAF domain-containing protein